MKTKRTWTDGKLFNCVCVVCGKSFKSSHACKKTCPPLYSKTGVLLKDCTNDYKKEYNRQYNKEYYQKNTDKVLVKNRLWWAEVGKLKYKKKRRKKKRRET